MYSWLEKPLTGCAQLVHVRNEKCGGIRALLAPNEPNCFPRPVDETVVSLQVRSTTREDADGEGEEACRRPDLA